MPLRPEEKTQIAIVKYLQLQHPDKFKYLINIRNEGNRGAYGQSIARRMGLRKYAADLLLSYPCNGYHGLYMEVKRDGWKGASGKKETEHLDGQLDFLLTMNEVGYYSRLVVGVDNGIKVINEYLTPSQLGESLR